MEFTIGGGNSDETPKRTANASTAPKSATGKKPGRPSTSARQRDNVAAALSTMESAYSALSMGALIIGKPLTAELIAVQSEQWQAANRQSFESSPKLASAIAGVGQASGVATFLATNIIAVGSIIITLRKEAAAQAIDKAAATPPEDGTNG
jgi:hypothetical protein